MGQKLPTLTVEEKVDRYKKIIARFQKISDDLNRLEKEGNILFEEVHQVIDKNKMKKVLGYISKKGNNF